MDPTAPAVQQPTQEPKPAKPGRKPLDEAGRAKAAQRAVVRKLNKRLSGAQSEEEFWKLAEEAAKKSGRALEAPKGEAGEKQPAIAPGWPAPQAMAKAAPIAGLIVGGLEKVLAGSRYGQLSEVLEIELPGEDGKPFVQQIPKRQLVQQPLTGVLANLDVGGDLPPGWAMVGGLAIVFGPPAAMHAFEVVGPKLAAWWAGPKEENKPAQPAQVVKLEAKKGA